MFYTFHRKKKFLFYTYNEPKEEGCDWYMSFLLRKKLPPPAGFTHSFIIRHTPKYSRTHTTVSSSHPKIPYQKPTHKYSYISTRWSISNLKNKKRTLNSTRSLGRVIRCPMLCRCLRPGRALSRCRTPWRWSARSSKQPTLWIWSSRRRWCRSRKVLSRCQTLMEISSSRSKAPFSAFMIVALWSTPPALLSSPSDKRLILLP